MSVHENFLLKKVLKAWQEYTTHLSQQGFDSELTEAEWDNKGNAYGAANSALNKLLETYPEESIFSSDKKQEEELDELSEKELGELIKKATQKIEENQKKMKESGIPFTDLTKIEPVNFAGGEFTDGDGKPLRQD